MTDVAHTPHEAQPHAPAPPRRGLKRLTGPGFLRAAWMTPLFWAFGTGIVLFFRWLGDYEPTVDWTVITVVAFLTTAPIGFLAGIGAFDYWVYYISGRPTRVDDHASHGAYSWRDYFKVNTDHKVIGVQYLVTTFFFFTVGGLHGDDLPRRARESGHAVRRHADLQRARVGARGADDLPLHHPGVRRVSPTSPCR